jgi:hypothetical protein
MKRTSCIPEIKEAKKIYDEAIDEFYEMGQRIEKAVSSAGCLSCDIYIAKYEGKNWPDSFFDCTGCKFEKKILDVQKGYSCKTEKMNKAKRAYAKAIFEHFQKSKPRLYSNLEKKNIDWDIAFPGDFVSVPVVLYTALIALAENKTGRYTIASGFC